MSEASDEALIAAAASGDTDRVAELLSAGADPNARVGDFENEAGKTPLGEAVRHGHTDATLLLLDRGGSLDCDGIAGCDLVTSALLAGHHRLADQLYARGARTRLLIGLCVAGHRSAVHEILVREPDRWGEYFLDAIRSGHIDMVEESIARNPDATQISRITLLFSAITQWRLMHWYPRQVDGVDDGFDRAAYQRILRRLLEWGMDPNMRTSEGVTAMHRCAFFGRPWSPTPAERAAHARILIEFGADLQPRDASGRTPLSLAVEHDMAELADVLRSHGATD